jgi:hypothetical protein
MKNYQKGSAKIILIIIFVFVAIFGGLVYLGYKHPSGSSETIPDSTLPGVVYENKEAGISFTFPGGWIKMVEQWRPNDQPERGVKSLGGVVYMYPLYGTSTDEFRNPRIAISNSSLIAGPELEARVRELIGFMDKSAKIQPITLNGDKGFVAEFTDTVISNEPIQEKAIITGHYDIFAFAQESDWKKFESQINAAFEAYKVVLPK